MSSTTQTTAITITSPAFRNNEAIPKKFTADGEDVSPELIIDNVPQSAKELVIIVDDPDAPTTKPWVHWVLYKIPPETRKLKEGIPAGDKLDYPALAMQGRTSGRKIGYNGPNPPAGKTHHYFFKVYALSRPMDARPGMTKDEVRKGMEGIVVSQGELVGTYKR